MSFIKRKRLKTRQGNKHGHFPGKLSAYDISRYRRIYITPWAINSKLIRNLQTVASFHCNFDKHSVFSSCFSTTIPPKTKSHASIKRYKLEGFFNLHLKSKRGKSFPECKFTEERGDFMASNWK